MSCNWTKSNNKITGALTDQGEISKLFNNAEIRFGLEKAIEIFKASKSKEFLSIYGNEKEPSLQEVLKYITEGNKNENTLTAEQIVDYRNVMLGVKDFNTELFYDANGLFVIDENKLSAIYSPYEIESLKFNIYIQNQVKNAVEALNNTETLPETSEQFDVLEKTADINSFGKLTNMNPYVVQREITQALGGTTEEEFDQKLQNLDFPNTKEIVDKDSLINDFSRAEVMQEIDGVIQSTPQDDVVTLLKMKKVTEDTDLLGDLSFILGIEQDILERSGEAYTIIKSLEERLLEEGLDVIGLSDKIVNKDYLRTLYSFLINPSVENMETFAQAQIEFFGKSSEAKQEVIKANKKDRNYVLLNTNLSEEEVYNQQGLIKEKEGVYIKVNKKSLEDMYAILSTYKDKYPSNITIQEFVQKEIGKLKDFKNAETAEAVYLFKMYFNVEINAEISQIVKQGTKFEGDVKTFESDFYANYLVEKSKNSKLWKTLYQHFDFNEKGIKLINNDPITLADLKDLASEKLVSYSLISKQMPSLAKEQEEIVETVQTRRDQAINNPASVSRAEGQISIIDDNNLILKNSTQEFVQVNGDIFEHVDSTANLSLYTRLDKNTTNYLKHESLQPETEVNIFDYLYLSDTSKDSTNMDTFDGMINSLVKQDLITGESYQNNWETVYITKGNSAVKKSLNAEEAKESVRKLKGFKSASTLKNGDLVLRDIKGIQSLAVTTKKGTVETVSKAELDAMSFEELSRKYEEPLGIIAERELRDAIPTISGVAPEQIEFVPENELQLKLMNLLKKMGVKTLDIATYMEQYTSKNGVPPSAQALSNIAEQVVAFKDGIITTADLAEETAHFIVSATPQVEKENLLRNIHKTQEWVEFSEEYRNLYKDEALLREEILGKVLANALQVQFATQEGQTETQRSILNRLIDIVDKFFNKIQAFFKEDYRNELQDYSQKVYNNLMRETLELDTTKFKDYKFEMFSVGIGKKTVAKDIYDNATELLDMLTNQENKLSKNRASLTKEQIKDAREIIERRDELEKLKAFSMIAVVAEKQLNHLERSMNKNKGKFPFSQEENAVYETFQHTTKRLLAEVSARLDSKNREEVKIQKQISEVITKFALLEGKVGVQENTAIDRLVENVATKHNLTSEQVESFKQIINATQKDTTWLHAHLGTLINARNPLLNLAGDVINKTVNDSRNEYLRNIKKFTNRLTEVGVNPTELNKLFDKGFILNEFDFTAQEQAELQVKTEVYNSIKGTQISAEEFKAIDQDGLVLGKDEQDPKKLTFEQGRQFNTQVRERTVVWRENFFTDEYMAKQEELFKDIPVEAIEYHKRDRALRSDIRANSTQVDGVTIYDSNNTYELQQLDKKRALNSASRDVNGDLKYGLIETFDEDTQTYVLELDSQVIVSEEAKIAYGLTKIAELNRKSFEGAEDREVPQKFLDKLDEIETVEEQLEFLFNNAYVGFSDSFWDNFGNNVSLATQLREAGELDLVDKIRKQQQIISGIQKQNRTFNRPSETNVLEMSAQEKATVKEATEELEDLYKEAKKALGEQESEETAEILYDKVVNEAYQREIEDRTIDTVEEELEFIKKNVTSNNRRSIDKFSKVVQGIKDGTVSDISGFYSEYISTEMTDEALDKANIDFAKSRLLPYYKRTEPTGFTDLLNGVRNEEISIEEFINSDLVKVSPNFSFYETQVNDNINPKFLENKLNNKPQIKEQYFKNQKFVDTFGTITNGKASKNDNLYQAQQALLELQTSSLQSLNLDGKHNVYRVPQIGKRGLRQVEDLLKKRDKGTALEMVKDFFEFREDEQEFGRASGIIPQYYTRILDNQEDVTDELLYSYAMMAQQASLYKARVENVGDMLSIKQAVINADYGGKSADATNTYKMFQSYLDYNMYGIKETFSYQADIFGFKVDLAALAKRFRKWIQLVNISGLIIPLTGAIQGSVVKRIESIIGETINSTAEKLGNKEFLKMSKDAMGESFGINSNAKMNVLLEAIGMYDITQNRFENSNYNKFTRGMTKWAQITHDMSNFTVNPRVALAVFNDYRYVNGKILNLNQYKRAGLDKAQWESFELFYNDIYVEEGVTKFDYKNISDKLGLVGATEEDVKPFVDTIMEAITNRTATAIQRIDTQIPSHEKSLAARHGIANFFLLHQNWLLLAVQTRFKDRHLNLNSGEYESGSWATAYSFLKDITVNFSPKAGLSYIAHIKKVWEEGDQTTRRNLMRVITEMSFVNVMLVLSFLLSKALEDDDDPLYALQLADYMLYRVTNEQISGTVALPRQFSEAIANPIKGIDRFYDLKDIGDLTSSDLVKSGKFAGKTERYRWISRNIPIAKDIDKLADPNKERLLYKHFNEDNEAWTLLAYQLIKEDK